MGDSRYDHVWRKWETLLDAQGSQSAALSSLTESDLVMLLAAGNATTRPYERNVIATALLNRLSATQSFRAE